MPNLKAYIRLYTNMMHHFARHILYRRWVRTLIHKLHTTKLPGKLDVYIYDVLSYFLVGIFNGGLAQRAKGLAYSFLAALPPMMICVFSLVAFFPVDGVQDELLNGLGGIVPGKILDPLSATINDVMGHKHKTLLSIGFIASVLLAANGVNGFILSLNFANHSVEKRPFMQRFLLCIMMVFVMYIIIVLVLSLLIGHKYLLQLIFSQGWLSNTAANTLMFNIGRWLLLSLATLFAVAFLYYCAPAKRQRVGFFSPGSMLATGMFFVLSWGFGIYLNNFNRYNLLYGSIGTLLLLMLWIYFTCIVLLVGYELNTSIYNGTLKQKNRASRKELKNRIQLFKDDNTKK